VGARTLKSYLERLTFVQQLFEPELVNLMDSYKKQLIVLWAI
jgi:hypothetical protein